MGNYFETKQNTAEKGTCFSLSIVAFSDPKYCCNFLLFRDKTVAILHHLAMAQVLEHPKLAV